jgi:hypothetical protein
MRASRAHVYEQVESKSICASTINPSGRELREAFLWDDEKTESLGRELNHSGSRATSSLWVRFSRWSAMKEPSWRTLVMKSNIAVLDDVVRFCRNDPCDGFDMSKSVGGMGDR